MQTPTVKTRRSIPGGDVVSPSLDLDPKFSAQGPKPMPLPAASSSMEPGIARISGTGCTQSRYQYRALRGPFSPSTLNCLTLHEGLPKCPGAKGPPGYLPLEDQYQ